MNSIEEYYVPIVVAVFHVLAIITSIIISAVKQKFELLNLKFLVLFIYGMLYGVSALDNIFFRYIDPNDVNYVTIIVIFSAIGYIFFELGYAIPIVKMKGLKDKTLVVKSLTWDVVICYIIAIFSIVFFEINGEGIIAKLLDPLNLKNTSELEWWFFYIQWGIYFSHIGFWLLVCDRVNKGSKIFDMVSIILFICTFFVSFCLNRYSLICFLLPLIVILHFHKKRINFVKISIFGVFAGMYFLVWDIYRNAMQGTDITENKSISESIYDGFMANLDYFDTLLRLLKSSQPFLNGSTYLVVLVKPIPRSIWVDKPMGANSVLTADLFPEYFLIGRSRAASIVTEAYMNFGWIGVLIVMFFTGVLCKNLYHKYILNDFNIWNTLKYAIAMIFLLTLVRVDMQIASTFLMYYLIPISVSFYLRTKTKVNQIDYENRN